jgi:hypothetical protein
MDKAYTYSRLTKVIQHLIAGDLSGASAMLETDYNDYNPESEEFEFYSNFRRFIDQYSVSTHFLNAISEGKLDVEPPDDPFAFRTVTSGLAYRPDFKRRFQAKSAHAG